MLNLKPDLNLNYSLENFDLFSVFLGCDLRLILVIILKNNDTNNKSNIKNFGGSAYFGFLYVFIIIFCINFLSVIILSLDYIYFLSSNFWFNLNLNYSLENFYL